MSASAAAPASASAKKPRAKRQASTGLAKNELIERYGAFGDAQADSSAEEARQVREKVAKWADVPQAQTVVVDEFARNYEALFGAPLPPAPAAPPVVTLDLGPVLKRCVEGTFFGTASKPSAALIRETALFSTQCKALAANLFAYVTALIALCPQLSAFHTALRQHPHLTSTPLREKHWQDACQPEGVLVPADAGYRILALPGSNTAPVAVPRSVAYLLSVCHAVYHVVGYVNTAILMATTDELQARVLGQPLTVVWAALCGGEPWATQTPVREWRWEAAPPFVQSVVQLRAALNAARIWIKEPALH